MVSIPGAYTPTEIMNAYEWGADIVKIFPILPDNIEYIESFAHKENSTSLSLQKWLGMVIIDETNEKLFHLRGDVNAFKSKIR